MTKEKMIKRILYLGDHSDFYGHIKNGCSENIQEDFEINREDYTPGEMIKSFSEFKPNILFFDFTSLDASLLEDLFREILFIKRIEHFKGALFVAIWGDSFSKEKQQHLFSSGFHLGYFKNTEIRSIITDCLYIGLDEQLEIPTFAKAKNINLELEIGMCSTITAMTSSNLCIETDLEKDKNDESFSLGLNLLADKKGPLNLKVNKKLKSISDHFIMTENYFLEYPLKQRNDLKQWIKSNNDTYLDKSKHVQIISNNDKVYSSLYQTTLDSSLYLEVFDTFGTGLFLDSRASLIFINTDNYEVPISCVGKIIKIIKEIDGYNPVLIVLNNLSKADALRKVYGYSNIICAPDELSADIFKLFMRSFLEKENTQENDDFIYFKHFDLRKIIDVYHTIEVTSLSEHEVTFTSEIELPFFTVLHFSLPFEFFVTLVPSHYELGPGSKKYHYLGFIHSLSEKKKQTLRRFINQIIYKPLDELSDFNLSLGVKIKEIKNKDKEQELISSSPPVEIEEEIIIKDHSFKRPQINGKSKL